MRAYSQDGSTWRKDEAWRYRYPGWHRDRMSYYAGQDCNGRIWFRTSVHDGRLWRTELRSGRDVLRLDGLSTGAIGGFCWQGKRLYLASKGDGRAIPSAVIAIEPDREGGGSRLLPQVWNGLATGAIVEDVFVLCGPDASRSAWLSITEPRGGTAIAAFTSRDGLSWNPRTCRVGGAGAYANNPCIVALRDGGWRMYFRTGDRPALGNAIRSAVSTDLEEWRLESGVRIGPGGRWDTHGAAFPFVTEADGGGLVMYYTGYWGRCSEGDAAARYWAGLPLPTGLPA